MPTFDPDTPRVKHLSQSSPYRKGVLDTLELIYEKSHATETLEDFRKWISIQLANYEEE